MVCSLVLIYFDSPQLDKENKLYKTLDCWSRDKLNFDFLEKGLRIVSLLHFMYYFSRELLLMLYSINWPNFIVLFPFLFEILGNMCIAIVCFPGWDVTTFEVNLIFLFNLFFCINVTKCDH